MDTTRITPQHAGKALHYAAHKSQFVRSTIQRELEAELRGLLMAARMHGFRLMLEEARPRAVDLKNGV